MRRLTLLALLVLAAPAARAQTCTSPGGGFVGVYPDSLGLERCGFLAPGVTQTWYVIATTSGATVGGITRAEFRVDLEPADSTVTFVWHPNPISPSAIGDPFAGGGKVSFDPCVATGPAGSKVLLGTVDITIPSDLSYELVVRKHSAPVFIECASFTTCDFVTVPMQIMETPPVGDPIVSRTGLNSECLFGTPPSLASVAPTAGRNLGSLTLDLFGDDLVPDLLSARLARPGQTPIETDYLTLVDWTHVQAQFTVEGAEPGVWDLEVSNFGGTTTLSRAVVLYAEAVQLTRSTTVGVDADPALSGGSAPFDTLAFVSDRGLGWGIYYKAPDAPDVAPFRRFATGATVPRHPSWSPDGTRLTYEDFGIVYNADARNNARTALVGSTDLARPAWSPVGDVIAYSGPAGTEHALFVINADGSGVRQITTPLPGTGMQDLEPSWSPDGERLVFRRQVQILSVSVDAGEAGGLEMLASGDEVAHPAWSPDGRWIAYQDDRTGNPLRPQLVVRGSRGAGHGDFVVTQTPLTAANQKPGWNRDATRLTFVTNRSGIDEIWLAGDLPIAHDADADLRPDAIDACAGEGTQLGRVDRDFDGCLDGASSFRTLRFWSPDRLPLSYEVDAAGDPRIGDGSEFTAIAQAYAAWAAVPGTGVSIGAVSTSGPALAASGDGRNSITFSDPDAFIPGFLGFAAVTTVTADTVIAGRWYRPGEVVDADILFNAAHFSFRTASFAGEPGSFDLQSVATHEIGHQLGLAHSSVQTATMFFSLPRTSDFATLEADDAAALRRIYAGPPPSLSGRVLRSDGLTPIVGAALLAIAGASGDTLQMTVSGIDGSYAFFDLAESFRVYALPLDGGPDVGGLIPAAVNATLTGVAETDFLAEYWDGAAESNVDFGLPGQLVSLGMLPVSGADVVVNEDITAPQVVTVNPGEGAVAPLSTAIAIKFDDRIELASITGSTLGLRNLATGLGVAGGAALLQRDSLLVFTPSVALAPLADYELTIGPGIRDRSGNAMPAAVVVGFSTQAAPPLALNAATPFEIPIGGSLVLFGSGFDPDPAANEVQFAGAVTAPADGATFDRLFVTVPAGAQSGALRVQVGSEISNELDVTIVPPRPLPLGNLVNQVGLGADVRRLAILPDASRAYVATAAGVTAVGADPTSAGFLGLQPIAIAGGCTDVAALPGGQRVLAVGPVQPRLRVIDTALQTVVAGVALADEPLGMAVVPGGGQILAAYADRVVLHSVQSDASFGLELREWSQAGVGFRGDLAIGPDAGQAYAATTDGRIAVLGLQAGEGVVALLAGGPQPREIAASPDGVRFVAVDADGVARLGDERGPIVETLPVGGGYSGVVMSPEGLFTFAANFTLNRVDVFDLQGGGLDLGTSFATGIDPRDLVTGAQGRYVYVVTGGPDRLEVYDTQDAPRIAAVAPPSGGTGTLLVVSGSGFDPVAAHNEVRIGGVAHAPLSATATTLEVRQLAGVEAGPVVVTTNGKGSNAHPYQVVNRANPGAFAAAGDIPLDAIGGPSVFVQSPSGKLGFLFDDVGGAAVVQMDGGRPDFHRIIQTLTAGETGLSLADAAAFTPDGRRLYVSDTELGSFESFDVDASDPVTPLRHRRRVPSEVTCSTAGMAATPDGSRVYAGDESNDLVFEIDTAADSVVAIVTQPFGGLFDLDLHPNGDFAYVGAQDDSSSQGVVHVLDIRPASPTFRTIVGSIGLGLGTNFRQLVVRPDGLRLYAMSGNFIDVPAAWSVLEVDPQAGVVLGAAAAGTGAEPAMAVNHSNTLLYCYDSFTARHQAFLVQPALATTPILGPTGGLGVGAQALTVSLDDARLYTVSTAAFKAGGGARPQAPGDALDVVSLTPAGTLAFESGTGQIGVVDEPLPAPIVVRQDGVPAALAQGTLVRFEGTNGGFASPEHVGFRLLGADGRAAAQFVCGPAPGTDSLTVSTPTSSIATSLAVVADTTAAPPVLVAVAPKTGEQPGVNTLLAADFSRAIDPATVGTTSFVLRPEASGGPLPGVYTFADDGRRVVLAPQSPLAAGTSYLFELTAALADHSGKPLANPGVFAFVTAPPSPPLLRAIQAPAARVGDPVVLSGQGFGSTPGESQAFFGDRAATTLKFDPGALVVLVPSGATSGPVRVLTGPDSTNALQFEVVPSATAPVDEVVAEVSVPTSGQQIAIVPDGSRAYMTSPGANTVVPIVIRDEAAETAIPVGRHPFGVTAAPGGKLVFVTNFFSNDVSVVDADPTSASFQRVVHTIRVGQNPAGLAINPDGRTLYVANYGDSTLTLVDTDSTSATYLSALASSNTGTSGQSVAVTPDGGRVIVGTATGILILDAHTGAALASSNTGTSGQSVAVTPDGALVLVLTSDGQLILIDIRPGSPTENRALASSNTGTSGQSVAVTPDGGFAYVTHSDGRVQVFEIVQLVGAAAAKYDAPAASWSLVPISEIQVGENPTGLAFDPSGSGLLLVVNAGSKTVSFIDTGGGSGPPEPLQGQLALAPSTLNLRSGGKTVSAWVELPPPHDPAAIDVASVRLNGSLPVHKDLGVEDHDGDGIGERHFKFDREGLMAVLGPEQTVIVTVTGLVDSLPFVARDSLRVLRPRVQAPRAGDVLHAGSQVPIRWIPMQDGMAHHVSILVSFDRGQTTEIVVEDTPDDSLYLWSVPARPSRDCLLYVVARDARGRTLGIGTAGGPLTILDPTDAQASLPSAFRLQAAAPNPFLGGTSFFFELPEPRRVLMRVYAVDGTLVRTLARGVPYAAGRHLLAWDGRNQRGQRVGSGVYFVHFQAGGWQARQKVVRLQ